MHVRLFPTSITTRVKYVDLDGIFSLIYAYINNKSRFQRVRLPEETIGGNFVCPLPK